VAEAAGRGTVFLEVALVVLLGAPESGGFFDHGGDGTRQLATGVEAFLRGKRLRLLLR